MLRSCVPLFLLLVCAAQQQPGESSPSGTAADLAPVVTQLEQAAQTTSLDLAHLRIEKWKGDKAFKADATAKADSLEKNLTAALPGMVAEVRAAPGSIAPALKLYRNLNAVYDVLASLAEMASAFGPKDEFRGLAADLETIDSVRRDFADKLENMAAAHDAELKRLRTQAKPAPPSDVKKIVVDDNQPAPKQQRRKKPATPQASAPKPQ